jgi:hypothetical protein
MSDEKEEGDTIDPGRPGKPTPPKGDPENPSEPGESTAGRGGIISPGGQQPEPTEDPRQDSGIPQKQPKD